MPTIDFREVKYTSEVLINAYDVDISKEKGLKIAKDCLDWAINICRPLQDELNKNELQKHIIRLQEDLFRAKLGGVKDE